MPPDLARAERRSKEPALCVLRGARGKHLAYAYVDIGEDPNQHWQSTKDVAMAAYSLRRQAAALAARAQEKEGG